MAVAHFSLPDNRAITELVAVAKSAGMVRAERELQRARLRHGLSTSLTSAELNALHERADQLPPRVRPVIVDALLRLQQAEAWERMRDNQVKPALNERRRQLQEELARA